MASIHKRGGVWRVMWRDPDGKQRSRTCPNKATAEELLREVERVGALGHRWEPSGLRERAGFSAIAKAFLDDSERLHCGKTTLRYGQILGEYTRWLVKFGHLDRSGTLNATTFTRSTLAAYHAYMLGPTGRHGHPRSPSTAAKHLRVVQLFWAWAWENDEGAAWAEQVPPPRRVRLPTAPATTTQLAPTWAQMDAAIAACDGNVPLRSLAVMLRFTGLRVDQVMRLRWDDVDLEDRLLRVRPELGKSPHERAGRVVPISGHLVAELRSWARTDAWIVPSSRQDGSRSPGARERRDMTRAWARAGVPKAARTQPHHSFRHGFCSELKRAKADVEAVEHLVGHKLPGQRPTYVDPRSLPLVEAVALIPALRCVIVNIGERGRG